MNPTRDTTSAPIGTPQPRVNPSQRHVEKEREIDETGAESFPASDPPSWVPLTGIRSTE